MGKSSASPRPWLSFLFKTLGLQFDLAFPSLTQGPAVLLAKALYSLNKYSTQISMLQIVTITRNFSYLKSWASSLFLSVLYLVEHLLAASPCKIF